jgi:hypothetical protein
MHFEGWRINSQDIACNYDTVLTGFSSVFGDMAGVLSPIVAGYLTQQQVVTRRFYLCEPEPISSYALKDSFRVEFGVCDVRAHSVRGERLLLQVRVRWVRSASSLSSSDTRCISFSLSLSGVTQNWALNIATNQQIVFVNSSRRSQVGGRMTIKLH